MELKQAVILLFKQCWEKKMKFRYLIILCLISFGFVANAQDVSKAADGTIAYIISPAQGEVVSSPLTVKFGLSGMGVAPAGIDVVNTGHHHLIVDQGLPDLAQAIPSNDNYRH